MIIMNPGGGIVGLMLQIPAKVGNVFIQPIETK